jgi:hypothetical protein
VDDPDGVKFAVEIATPEFQKAAKLGKIRGCIDHLPDLVPLPVRSNEHVRKIAPLQQKPSDNK